MLAEDAGRYLSNRLRNENMKALRKYAHHQFKALSAQLKKFRQHRDTESLHDIRVCVKKIKALLQLLKFSDSRFKAHKAFLPFRTLFRKAGEIRDPEVHAGLLLKFNVSGVEKLGSGKKAATSFVKNIPSLKRKVKEQIKPIHSVVKRVSKKEVRKFIERQEKEIRSKLYPQPVMKEIHRVRKAMKSVVYLSEIENFLSEKTLAFYREMEEAIGDFHDQQVVLGLLSQDKLQDETKRKLMLRECRTSSAHIRKCAHHFYRS